jgi:hypothetical protein
MAKHGSAVGVVRSLMLLAVFTAVACDREELPTHPGPAAHPSRSRISSRLRHAAVAYLDSISAAIPEFGGYYLDGQRNLVVFVTDTTKFAKARLFVAAEITHHRIRDKAGEYLPKVVLRKGDFSFSQLQGWADAVSDNITGNVAGGAHPV